MHSVLMVGAQGSTSCHFPNSAPTSAVVETELNCLVILAAFLSPPAFGVLEHGWLAGLAEKQMQTCDPIPINCNHCNFTRALKAVKQS